MPAGRGRKTFAIGRGLRLCGRGGVARRRGGGARAVQGSPTVPLTVRDGKRARGPGLLLQRSAGSVKAGCACPIVLYIPMRRAPGRSMDAGESPKVLKLLTLVTCHHMVTPLKNPKVRQVVGRVRLLPLETRASPMKRAVNSRWAPWKKTGRFSGSPSNVSAAISPRRLLLVWSPLAAPRGRALLAGAVELSAPVRRARRT